MCIRDSPRAEVSIEFFKKVQNKIHYAIHGETAAEVIFHRADAEKEFMGVMSFSGNHPTLKEAKIAKNYLDGKELRAMGQLVSGYLDFAERQAERGQIMTMKDLSLIHISRFTLNATSGILAPTAVTPAVGWIVSGPKSGAHSSCLSSSQPFPQTVPYGFLQGSLCEEL